MKNDSNINAISILKRIIWVLFFTQPFWGYPLPTSVPFWILVILFSLFIYVTSKNRITLFEKLLISFVLLSSLGWFIIGKLDIVNFYSDSRNVLQHFIVAFSILLTIQSIKDVNIFLATSKWFVWGTVIFSVFSILNGSFFNTNNFDAFSGFERAGGWLEIPNAYSPFLVLSIIICFYQYKIKRLKKYKYLLALLFLFLLATLSRNGFLAIAVFSIYSIYQYSYKNEFKRKSRLFRNIIKFSVVLSFLAFILITNFQTVIEAAVYRDINIKQGQITNTRILFWGAQIYAINQWDVGEYIFGVNYDSIFENLEKGLGYRIPEDIVNQISPVENGFLYIFVGSGMIGLLILILMFIYAWKILNRAGLNETFVYFIKGLILALLVQTMFMEFMLLGIKTYYFVFMGLSYKYLQISIKNIPLTNNVNII